MELAGARWSWSSPSTELLYYTKTR